MQETYAICQKIIDNVEKVIVGKRSKAELALISLLCQGHLLIEDVPGVGKTTLAKSIARSVGCTFRRIQFTPDLLPSDITGVSIYNQKNGDFEFRPGPVMAQIVLADEINRASPKTQSALLECMEERQVTVDGTTYRMPQPFTVIATQNPIEYQGTYPLPEAQLDRFMLRIGLDYPSAQDEVTMMENQQYSHPIEEIAAVCETSQFLSIQGEVKKIEVSSLVRQYIVSLVGASRNHSSVYLGASPRGSLSLFRTGQALAMLHGREYVLPDDIKELAEPTLAHRLILTPAARMKNTSGKDVIAELLASVPVPGIRAAAS